MSRRRKETKKNPRSTHAGGIPAREPQVFFTEKEIKEKRAVKRISPIWSKKSGKPPEGQRGATFLGRCLTEEK